MNQQKLQTVLVVEDIGEISAEMKDVLNRRGHEVMVAPDAEQALQMAERNRPAMILTDLDLPTFDTLMSLLRGHKELNNLIVAVIDINGPKVGDKTVNILPDFEALDDLIQSSQKTA